MQDAIRTFVALRASIELSGRLEVLSRRLRQQLHGHGISWVAREQFHITLRFLGQTQRDTIPALCNRLATGLAGVSAFRLSTSELGCFPDLRRPKVLWVGFEGDLHSLKELYARIREATEGFGEAKDEKMFHPHLTVARFRFAPSGLARVVQFISGTPAFDSPIPWPIRDVGLIQSVLGPDGPAYTTLKQFELKPTGSVL
jgi:2'-5' RNA ligase